MRKVLSVCFGLSIADSQDVNSLIGKALWPMAIGFAREFLAPRLA
jgi:hypothetical protein